jgi:hypothetical protein
MTTTFAGVPAASCMFRSNRSLEPTHDLEITGPVLVTPPAALAEPTPVHPQGNVGRGHYGSACSTREKLHGRFMVSS